MISSSRRLLSIFGLGTLLTFVGTIAHAQLGGAPAPPTGQAAKPAETTSIPQAEMEKIASKKGEMVALNPEKTLHLDRANGKLIVDAKVVLREGMLEMLLCRRQTKEHESILAFDGEAKIMHAGLLALGIEPGTPVTFIPDFKPPSGPILKIELIWKDKQGKEQRALAQQWIRHSIHRYFAAPLDAKPADLNLAEDDPLRYDATNKELSWYGPMTAAQRDRYLTMSQDKQFRAAMHQFHDNSRSRQMEADFVFTGSTFIEDDSTGVPIYLAESGDVICVANFPSALIDIAQQSSAQGQENLLYEAWTDRIPPRGTPVRMEISRQDKKDRATNDSKEK